MSRRLASAVAADLTHQCTSPRWECGPCGGRPWPCGPAREQIAASFGGDKVGMAMYMGEQLVLAARDIRDTSPQDLYLRFVAWTRWTKDGVEQSSESSGNLRRRT